MYSTESNNGTDSNYVQLILETNHADATIDNTMDVTHKKNYNTVK
jgi:hypothetical protein